MQAKVKAAAAGYRKRNDGLRADPGTVGMNIRQRYMLSYLSSAQRRQWDSYSPARQRKIMEEIEKKLDRKIGNPYETAEIPEQAMYNPEAYAESEKTGEYRIRGHPEPMMLRQIEQADIRTRQMVMRVGSKASMISIAGKTDTARKALLARQIRAESIRQKTDVKMAGKNYQAASGGKKQLQERKLQERNLQERERQESNLRVKTQQDARAGNASQHGHGPGKASVKGFAEVSPAKRMYQTKEARSRRERGLQKKLTRRGEEHSEVGSVSSGDNTFRGVPAGLARRESMKSAAKETVGSRKALSESRGTEMTDHNQISVSGVQVSGDDLRKIDNEIRQIEADADVRTSVPSLPVTAAKAVSGKAQLMQESKKGGISVQEHHPEKTPDFGRDAVSDMLLPAAVQPETERRSVLKEKETEEMELLRPVLQRMTAYRKEKRSRSGKGIRERTTGKLAKKEAKNEAAYRKAFVSELTAIIEKDIAKGQQIRQAQKSGQISASVAELTGETGRSAVRTAAIPLRLHLHFIGKKLREELKKRMKEAVRNLMRHAATFGAPVFAVVIIVMLLASICMIGTTEDSPRGTGLGFKIVQEAKKHIGLPYVYGGTSLVDGCDCSGFVWAIYNIFGYNLPRTAGDQYAYGRKVGSDVSDWQLGDLIYYSRTGSVQSGGGRAEHIVIYIGGGQVISCGPVAIYNWDYRSDYYGTCRIIPDEPLGGDFSGSTNEEVCWNYFISQGFSEAATAGILGNMYVESGGTFDPSIHQYGGGPGRGLCQWEESYSGGSGRYNNLVSFAAGLGKSWDDITAQLQFVSYELDSGAMNPYFAKFGGVEAFKNSTDPTTATYVFLCGFEYCGDPGASYMEANFSLSTRVDHAGWAYLNYQ